MNDGKTPKKPIKKEDNSKNSKQTNNVKVQKESCDTKARPNPRKETRIDETIDNDSFKKETCESKAKINEHEKPTLKQFVTQKETCTKLLPNKLPSQRPFLDLPTIVKECSSKDFIAPNGIKSPAQKSGAIKKTPKLLPIYQVLPQDKSTTKRDEIQIKNFQVEAVGSDKIKKTITIEHTKYPASTHCGSKLQSIDNQKFAPSQQANKSDIQRYLISKMAKLSGASFQRHGLPVRSVPTDNIEAKLEPVKIDAKQIDYERKKVYIKDRNEIDQSKDRDFTQDQFPTEVGANQLEIRDFARKRGCLKESTKKLDPRAKYQKDDKIIEGSVSKIEKRHDLSTARAITTDNIPRIKIDERAEEQFKMIEVPFADFIRDQYKETHVDFETCDEQLHVDHKKESCSGKIEEVPEILYKGTYKLRTIHENLPECYKLFDLSRDFEKEIETLDTEVAIEKSASIPDQPVIVETDYIIPRKGGCIPECGQVPIIKQHIKEEIHEMPRVLQFSEELEFEEPKYQTATITQLELTTEPEFGIDFELQQGVLIEPYDIHQGPPYRVPPKLYIAKDATLAEYDYIYEMIDKEKKIKKTEVQIARRRKLQEKPQFCQYIQQDKSMGEIHKSTVTKHHEEMPEQSKETSQEVYEINKLSVEKNLESEKLAEQKAINVDSYYKYEKTIFKEPIYEKVIKSKIPKELPAFSQKKRDEMECVLLTKRNLSSEIFDEVKIQPIKDGILMDSFYKYEKPIIEEPIYQKVSKSIVHKELPEYCQKKTGLNVFEILEKRKLSPEKYDEIRIQPGKEHIFLDSFYKYEKPIVEVPIYEKITKSIIYTELPIYSQKKTNNKEFEISTRRKLSSEYYEEVPTKPERDLVLMDSYYKYEKPIFEEPIYEKVIKSKIPKVLPAFSQKKRDEMECVLLTKRNLGSEKFDEVKIQPIKDGIWKRMDSFYKYEKPIIEQPIYQKVTKSIVHKKLPEYCQKKTGLIQFEILEKRKLSPAKYDEIGIQPGKEHVFLDSFYKYEKPIVEVPIYDKIIKSIINTELPIYSQKKTDNKAFQLSTRRKFSSEHYEELPTKSEKGVVLMDSYYKYEKPIFKKPIYENVIKSKILKELPVFSQNKRHKMECVILTKNLNSEKFDEVKIQPIKDGILMDSFYKYEKPIIKKPIYQKVTKSIVHKKLPEYSQKKAGLIQFEILEKRKLSPAKYDEIGIQPGKEHVFLDSFYKYEKPIVEVPIYEKIVKSILPKGLPNYSQKKTDKREFAISTKKKETGTKSGDLHTQTKIDAVFMDSYYKYEKPIIKKPTYKTAKMLITKSPYQKPKSTIKLKQTKLNRVDSDYKYEKASAKEKAPIMEKLIRTVLPLDKPIEPVGETKEDTFKHVFSDYTFSKSKVKADEPKLIPVFDILKRTIVPSDRPEFITMLKKFPFNLLDSDYSYKEPQNETQKITYDTAEVSIFSTEKPEQPLKLIEKVFKRVYSDYKYEKLTGTEKKIVIPVYHATAITDIPIDIPESCRKFKEKYFSWVHSNYNFVKLVEETSCNEIKYADISKLVATKPQQFERLKEGNVKYVDSVYKFARPDLTKDVQKLVAYKNTIRKPETSSKLKPFKINRVDSYYNYLKRQKFSKIPIYERAKVTKIPSQVPQSYQRLSTVKFDLVHSEYHYDKPKVDILPIVTDTIIKSKLPPEKTVLSEKTKKKEFLFIDSDYKYEKPPEEFVDKKKLLSQKIDLKQIEKAKPDFAIQTRGKEVVFVDSIYKYKKPVKHEEHEPIKVEKAAIRHISASKPDTKAKLKQYEHCFTDSYYIFDLSPKLKVSVEKEPFRIEKINRNDAGKLESSKLKVTQAKFVDSNYRFEKDKVVIKLTLEKAKVHVKLPEHKSKVPSNAARLVDSDYNYEKTKTEDIKLEKLAVMDMVVVKRIPETSERKVKKKEYPPILYVDSLYRYEPPKEKVKKPIKLTVVTKMQEVPNYTIKVKDKSEACFVMSDYIYEKPKEDDIHIKKPVLLQNLNVTRIEQVPFERSIIEKPEIKYVDSYYKYEKPKAEHKKLEPILLEKMIVRKGPESSYISKMKKPEIHFVDSVYRYEKHKGLSVIIEPVFEKATVTKTQEAPDQRTKRKPEAQYVDSDYKYEKPEPIVLEQAVAIKSKDTSTKLKSESVKDTAHYSDSDYIYEKLKDKQLVIVPEIQKAIISKVQAVPNQTSKMRVKPFDYVDSDYKYEECKEEKRPIQAEQVFFENAKVSKIHDIAIPKTQYKDKSIAQKRDSNYRFEKSIQVKDPLIFQKATFIKDREIPERKIKPKETDDPHFVDSEYEYEPPIKTSILEPIKIQTTIIHHHIDEPEYNVMINEHDAIWMNFVYKYEKIRPDLLEKITQNNLLIEIPERKQTHRDVYQRATNKSVPTVNRPKINVMKVPEFQIIPESYEESQHRPGPSTAFPNIESKNSSFGKRTKSWKKKWIRKLLKILKIHI